MCSICGLWRLLTYNQNMYLRDRLRTWSTFDPAVTCHPEKYASSRRTHLNVTLQFDAIDAGKDQFRSYWQPVTIALELDEQGRWCEPDSATLGVFQILIQAGCSARTWSWELQEDTNGNFVARVDDAHAESSESGFHALFDAYQQRLQRLDTPPA